MSLESDLKTKYGRIFRTVVNNRPAYLRLLTKQEFDTAMALNAGDEKLNVAASEYILSAGILQPPLTEFDDSPAYCLQGIALKLLELSGFDTLQTFANEVNQARQACALMSEQVLIHIMKAMPVYKIEDLENMTAPQLARLLALAEQIMQVQLPLESEAPKGPLLTPENPEVLRQKAREALEKSRKPKG